MPWVCLQGILTGILAVALTAGCGKKEPPRSFSQTTNSSAPGFNNLEYEPAPLVFKNPPVFAPSPSVIGKNHDDYDYALEWNRFSSVEEYKRFGKTNSTWDVQALAAIDAYAVARSTPLKREANPEVFSTIADRASEAVSAGCDDPLVLYLFSRYALTRQPKMTDAVLAQSYGDAARTMETTPYSPIRKAYASLRAAQCLRVVETNNVIRVLEIRRSAVNHVNESLHDRMMPPREASEICELMWSVGGNNKMIIRQIDETVVPTLENIWADKAFAHLLKGQVQIMNAWDSRGRGYASTVTDEGWKGFKEHLDAAETALRKAWSLDPKDPRSAISMITVCMGQSYPRPEMELWFNRAMDVDPNCFEAAQAKAFYLEPKWLGTPEALLQFGRECVASTRWKGAVPLILVFAHESLCGYLDEAEQPHYWEQPAVWKDVERGYECFFKLNPTDVSYRHNYASHAYRCGQYQVFLDQLTYFSGGTNYAYFGGKTQFDNKVRTAQAKSGLRVPKK